MHNNMLLCNLYLNPDVTADQYKDVRIVTIKSEYARIMWDVAAGRVGNNRTKILAEIDQILLDKEVQLTQFVCKQHGILTVGIDVDNVNDDEVWLTAVSMVASALDKLHNQSVVNIGSIIPIKRTDLPWFAYH